MTKKYDRKTKEWVDEEEYQGRIAKRKMCKGGREHDWVHVLPMGAEPLENYCGDAEMYYIYKQKIRDYEDKVLAELAEKYGIETRGSGYFMENSRNYVCSVCGRKDWKSKK